jgi:tetratricopeptide (TPR) repeat protein/serine phosphatase RsbU (regulator of sigma subunit)
MRKLLLALFVIFTFVSQAQKKISADSLMRMYTNKKLADTTRFRAYNDLIFGKYVFTRPDTALVMAQTLFEEARQAKSEEFIVLALNLKAASSSLMGDQNASVKFFEEALKNVNNKVTLKTQGMVTNNLSNAYRKMGEYDKAMELAGKALNIRKRMKDDAGIAHSLNSIAQLHMEKGDYKKALRSAFECLKIRERIGEPGPLASIYITIGNCYQDQKELRKAIECFEKSYTYYEKTDNKHGMAGTLSNIGAIYNLLNEFDKFLDYTQKSMKMREALGDNEGVAESSNNIGVYYVNTGNNQAALDCFIKARNVFRENGNKSGLIESSLNLSKAYRQIGDSLREKGNMAKAMQMYSKAVEDGKLAMKLASDRGSIFEKKEAAGSCYKALEAKGMKAEAFDALRLYYVLNDSIASTDNQKEMMRLQMKHDFDRKAAADSVKVAEEKKVVAAERKQERTQRFGLLGILILVAVFAVFMYNRFKVTREQKKIIEVKERETMNQKNIIEEKQKEIIDSINYAKRIQQSLLANEHMLNEYLPKHFVFFKPKDIVSGDFYWAATQGDLFYLAICDSTGHGVPGAFMSLLNIGFLSEAIKEKNILSPDKIFNYVRERLVESISKDGQRDGFDGILVCFDLKKKKITYAAANNAPMLLNDGKLSQLSTDKMPVGMGEKVQDFNLYTIDHTPNSMIYFYTDGYADQFGGPKGKKFMYKKLNELLFGNTAKPLEEQKQILRETFEGWRGGLEQVDDVCVVGICL